MAEQYDQGMDDADGSGSAVDVSSETDRPRPVDENGKENWAEDAEPLTRNEYADQIRQSEATPDHDSPADHEQDHDPHQPAVAEDGQDQEELPEPRTRQEVAAEAGRTDTTVPGHDQSADAAIDARIEDEDNLPEPRTRQEVAEEVRPGADPSAHPGSDVQQHERDTGDWPSPEERAQLHQTYLDWRNEITTGPDQSTGWDQGANVVGDKPDKSPGDRSDLPPSGEELLHAENDDASRLERLGNKIYEEFGDIADVAEKASNRAQEIFDHRPPAGHPEVRIPAQPYVAPTAEQHETPDAGNIAQLGLVLGVIGFRTYQSLRRKLTERKGG
jgi:hypothetical protein